MADENVPAAGGNDVTMYPQGVGDGPTPSTNITTGMPALSQTDQAFAQRPLNFSFDNTPVNTFREAAVKTAAFGVPSVAAGLLDTFGTSLGLIDDNKIGQLVGTVLPAWGDYYQRNKEPVKTIADITGMFIPGTLGVKAIQSTAKLRNVLADSGYATKLIGGLMHSGVATDEFLGGITRAGMGLAEQGVRDFTASLPEFQALKRSAYTTKLGDSIKEMVGFETAVAATMHSSETLYPSDQSLSSYLTLNAFGIGLPVAAEGLFMRRAINKAIGSTYKVSEGVLNPAGVNWSDMMFNPGNRDVGITSLSLSRTAQKSSIQEAAGDTTLLENLNRAVLSGDEIVKKQLTSLGTDNPFNQYGKFNLTSKYAVNDAQVKTARLMLQDDPTGLLGVQSFENPSLSAKDVTQFYDNKQQYVQNIKDDMQKNVMQIIKTADPVEKLNLQAKSNQLAEHLSAVSGSQEFILERTGEQTPMQMRKPRFTDGDWGLKVNTKRGTQTEPTIYSVQGITDDYYKGQSGVGVTGDFFVLLPRVEPAEQTIIKTTQTTPNITEPLTINVPVPMPGGEQMAQVMRTNIKQVVRPQDLALPENQAKLLNNLGAVFHWENGQLGKPITSQLPDEIKEALRAWTGNSSAGQLRQWEKTGAPQFQQLYNAFGDMRQQLHELKVAGSDGTIPLWRGESKSETAKPTNNLVSMSTNYNVASNFASGGNITRVWVPIDDIVASAGFKGENEFIVKNNLARRLGTGDDTILGSTKQNVTHVPVTLSVEQLQKLLPAQQQQTITNITKNIAASVPISNYEALDYKGRSAAFELMQKAVDNFDPASAGKMFVHDGEHWTRLDAIAELADRYGMDKLPGIQFPRDWGQGDALKDNLHYNILSGKYESFRLLQDMQQQAQAGYIKLARNQQLNRYDYQYLLNLPNEKNGQLSPVVKFFSEMYAQGTVDLKQAVPDMNAVRRSIQESADMDMPQISNFANQNVPLRGKNLAVPEDTAPIMAIKKNLDTSSFSSQAVAEKAAFERANNLNYLSTADQYGADLVKLITDTVQNSSVTADARLTSRLIEGSLPGKGIIGQANAAARGNATLQAANRLINMTDVQAKNWIAKLYEPHVPIFNDLRAVNNEGHLLSFNTFEQSRRFGWDLTGETQQTVRNGQNYNGFVMDKGSSYNRKMWERLFPDTPFPTGDKPLMPSIAGDQLGTPLFITDKAFGAVNSFSMLGKTALDNMNMIRRTLGLGNLNYKPFWMPPRNLARENVGYLVHGDGSKTVITGRTRDEMLKMKTQEEAILQEQGMESGKDYYWQDQKTLAQFKDINDEPFTNLQNFSDPLAQTGRSRGSTAKQTLERGPGVLNDMVTVLNNQLFGIAHRTQALNFSSEINHARMMHQMSGYSKIIEEPSIWQQYVNTIYGANPMTAGSLIGKEYSSTEDQYNMLMAAAFDKVRSWGGTGLNPIDNALELLRNHDKEFQSIRSQMQDFTPFKDASDFMEKTFKTSVPPTMRQHFGALNQFVSTMTLRFMEVGNAVLNGVSLLSTTPAVIRAIQKIPGESANEWTSRIGAYGSPVTHEIGALNPARLMTSTIHDFFNNDEFKAAMGRAANQGMFDQQVAELQKTLVAPQDGAAMAMLRKAIDKMSYVSDKSEQLSRMYGFGVGYKMGKDLLGLTNEKDQFLFGQKIADDIIGNYRSQNRPMIFQGALGMPLGLFQTYTWNYMHRLFGYVENRQWRALATQYGMQASIFGGKTVPGMDQFTQYIASANDGVNNPVDALRNRFGDPMADLLLYGTVSNIPKLFSHDGVSVYTRGDANVQRIPGVWDWDRTPVANMANNTWNILRETTDMFRQTGNFSSQRMGEILGTYLINRPIRNLFQLASGVSVDQSGEVISNDVRNGLSIAARLTGMRPLSESKEVEALSRVSATQKSQEYRVELLRDSARSSMRGGTFDAPQMEQSLRQYVQHGGDPVGFSRWLRDQFVSSSLTKGQRGLLDSLHDPLHMYDTLRLMHAGVADNES